jgi:hypothetical protein
LFSFLFASEGCRNGDKAGEENMPRKVNNAIEAAAQRRLRRATLSVGRRELCDYVVEIASEFGHLVRGHDLRFLAYLLAMVCEEAVHQSRIASDTLSPPGAATERDDSVEST